MITAFAAAMFAAGLAASAMPPTAGTIQNRQAPGDEAPRPLGIVAGLHRDLVVSPGESTSIVVVWDGDAVVAGTANAVIAINGNARLLGSARVGRVFVARGLAELEDGSFVAGDVQLVDAAVRLRPGATLEGEVLQSRWSRVARGLRTFGIIVGVGISLAVLLGAFTALAVAPVAMRRAGEALRGEVGMTILCTGLVWLVIPWLALELAATVVGLPIGLGYWIFVLPTLGFIGYLVSGVALGDALLRNRRGSVEPPHPYLTAALGIGLLLALGLIPILGIIVSALAAMVGSGAVVLAAGKPVERGAGPKRLPRPARPTEVTVSRE
jgi:hypothetical protein